MRNNFSKNRIKSLVNKLKKLGVIKELAERIYTSRLLGLNKDLVLHGGGNTSVKSKARDIDGEIHDIMYIKGSGSDLSTIEAKDFPAVKLKPLHKLTEKKFVTDEEMVSYTRKNLIDDNSPNPSVETLVHAVIQEKFIDHTHSNAILEITNRKNGYRLCQNIFGKEILVVPYVMPGFILAKKVNQLYKKNPNIKGIILFKHGIFTFGGSAQESYNRMIRYVSKAEKYLKSEKSKKLKKIKSIKLIHTSENIAPIIRGIVSRKNNYVLNFRTSLSILNIINVKSSKKFLSLGVVTPDHVLRIKPKILVINIDSCVDIQGVTKTIEIEIDQYKKNYTKYFNKYNKSKYKNSMLDPVPQIIAIQNLGIFSIGRTLSNAMINGDIAEMAIKTIGNIERKTSFSSISMKDIFDVEYWSLEQAKLKKESLPLSGKVTVITGGTGSIGMATANKFKLMGSEVILLDINKDKILHQDLVNKFRTFFCDVRDRTKIKKVFKDICLDYGGIDCVISNAGNAFEHEIATLSDKDFKKSFETNFFAHQIIASESVLLMKKQNLGGVLLFNISKQAVNPGKNFGAYGMPKSALLSLCKQYALEYGHIGIRSNGVNADKVESGLLTKTMIKRRSIARGVSVDNYLKGNILKKRILPEDVANAFYHLAISSKTTASIFTVDGGNIEASLR